MKTKALIKAENGAPAERSPPQTDAAGAAGADIRRSKKKNQRKPAAGATDSKVSPGD